MATSSLEAFLLAPDDTARAAVMEALVEGSEAWYELTLANLFRQGRGTEKATKDLIDRYLKAFPGDSASQLHLRACVLGCSAAHDGSEAGKKALAEFGREVLRLDFSHAPVALDRVSADLAATGGESQPSGLSVLPADVLPTRGAVLESLYKGDPRTLSRLHPSCYEYVDFSRFPADKPFMLTFLQNHKAVLPLLGNQVTLLSRLATEVRRVKAQRQGADDAPTEVLDLLTLEQLEQLAHLAPELRWDPAFVNALMIRKFKDAFDPDAKELLSHAERRNVLRELLAFVDAASNLAATAGASQPTRPQPFGPTPPTSHSLFDPPGYHPPVFHPPTTPYHMSQPFQSSGSSFAGSCCPSSAPLPPNFFTPAVTPAAPYTPPNPFGPQPVHPCGCGAPPPYGSMPGPTSDLQLLQARQQQMRIPGPNSGTQTLLQAMEQQIQQRQELQQQQQPYVQQQQPCAGQGIAYGSSAAGPAYSTHYGASTPSAPTPTVDSLKALSSQFMLEILDLNTRMNELDRELVLRYCREASVQQADRLRSVNEKCLQRSAGELGFGHPLLEQPAVRAHLRAFILEEGFMEAVKPLLFAQLPHPSQSKQLEWELKRFRDETALLSGRLLGHNDAAADWLEQVTKRASVELVKHNTERFQPEDEVFFIVRLKNVPQLTVRIYEINAESYYLHHERPFTSDINLDGVGATFEVDYAYTQPPILEHEETLRFPMLAGKQGLFVLDFVGAGLRSRAVIRKGTLLLVHKTSPVGHVAYVLGPDRQVVRSGAKLHLGGRWYECDETKGGRIIVPYGRTTERLKVIISALGMAQFSEFERRHEQFQLSTAFALFKETVVMGQLATVMLRPRLRVCGRQCDIGLLKKAEVTVSMRSGQEGVPTVRTYSGFDWRAGDLRVQFLVPPRLKSVEVTLKVEVGSSSKSETETLTSSRQWTVEDHADTFNWFELYLANTCHGYEIHCLGKDGEVQPGVSCKVILEGLLPADAILTTDSSGVVHLGALPNITAVEVATAGLARRWSLPKERGFQYPTQLDILEGEEVVLPCYAPAVLMELCASGEPIALRSDCLDTSSQANTLKIHGLQRGTYSLQIAGEQLVTVQVHRGRYWQDEYILRHDAILENSERPSVIAITNAEARPDGVSATLTGFGPTAKVHLYAFRFLPHDLLEIVQALQSAGHESYTIARFPFQMWKNLLQSDVRLGDELSYVLRRRKAPAQVGNMLKRPNLLMQPKAVKDTAFASEVVVRSEACAKAREMDQMCQQQQPMAMMQQACCNAAHYGGAAPMQACCDMASCNFAPSACFCSRSMPGHPRMHLGGVCARPVVDIQGFQNFLSSEAVVALNLEVSPTGHVAFDAALGDFACVLLVAADRRTVAHCLVPVAGRPAAAPSPSRGLTLATPLDAGQFFVEKRTATPLPLGDSFNILDQASAEWRAVDSVERLLAFYRAVRPEVAAPLEAWGLQSWLTLDRADKVKRWSERTCHELNLFLRLKDPAFFAEAVQPFLACKMEPGVVDHFLLGKEAALEPYLAPARFEKLNLLEQVLVIRAFSGRYSEKCKHLAATIRSRAAAKTKQEGSARRNALLDSVLNLEQPRRPDEWTLADPMEVDDDDSVRGFGGGGGGLQPGLPAPGPWGAAPLAAAAPAVPFGGGMPPQMHRARKSAHQARSASPRNCGGSGPESYARFNISAQEAQELREARDTDQWAAVEGTKEYAETQFHDTSGASPCPDSSFSISDFWADAAAHAAQAPETRGAFLSPNFIFATTSVHEVASAVALLDLPFTAEAHALVGRGGLAASFDAASPCVFVAKETVAVERPEAGSDLGVAVRVYKATLDETASQDPLAVREFLASEPYCLQVIVTNVSPRELEAQALVQIPQGALPLGAAPYTKAHTHRIGAFECWRIMVHFYFPRPGDFIGAPVFCSVDGRAVAMSPPVRYHVVRVLSNAEVETFTDVVRAGEAAVIAFLKDADLLGNEKGFSFHQLYPLLRKEAFYTEAVAALRNRGIFERITWGYAFHHGDLQTCSELLAAETSLHRRLGAFFQSPLISVSAEDAGFVHLEYFPLLNKRAHRLGEASGPPPILNKTLKGTYEAFIRCLVRKTAPLERVDRLRLSYYLLCQDRIAEARTQFELAGGASPGAEGAASGGTLQWQTDYLAAYFDLFNPASDLSTARRVAREHATCAHTAWRQRFAALAEAIAEIDAAAAPPAGGEVAAAVTSAAARTGGEAASAALTMTLRRGTLDIQATGIDSFTVRLYKVDLEMLFSRAPFIEPATLQSEFSFVKAIFEAPLPGTATTWDIPAEHRSADLAVELVGGTARVFRMHFASVLRVAISERQGSLTVCSEAGRPLPAVYVKVFARLKGREAFFKDGYTDLRGRFDYASLSGESASAVSRFSMLVVSEGSGGLVLEAAPPPAN